MIIAIKALRWMRKPAIGVRAASAWTVAALTAAVLVAAVAAPAPAAAEENAGRLVFSVTGEAAGAPDLARISFGVVAEAETAADAMAIQAEEMTAALAVVRDAGVADADIQTSGVSLQPVFSKLSSLSGASAISSYRAANRVTLTVRDLARTGAVLDAVVGAGVNEVNDVSFDIADPAPLMEAARADALRKVFERRDFFEEIGGLGVGALRELSEHASGGGPVLVGAARSSYAETPVAPGSLTVTVTLSATFALDDE